ncbi:MAG: IreB family regulatory phosphoprotein [Clostridia bacterium]|nr:IreB family regulatory phosphoprotein [Clostridia bacterium]
MDKKLSDTLLYNTVSAQPDVTAKDVIKSVYESLKSKGHDPIMQIVGYLLSGDPTYITSYNGARTKIRTLERDEILEELVSAYVERLEREN